MREFELPCFGMIGSLMVTWWTCVNLIRWHRNQSDANRDKS